MKDKVVYLKDGRSLGYVEYGQPDGLPVMLLHGTPGSKAWFLEDDETALMLGLRLIATDRPGFGTSTPKKGRTLLDWPDDLVELADHLGLGHFSVIGVSGGGAYAAACAYKIPERLLHVSMVASAAPFQDGNPPKSMMRENRRAFFLARYLPWIIRMSYKTQCKMGRKQPEKLIELMKTGNKHLVQWDQQFLKTDEQAKETIHHMMEAFKHGVEEGVREPVLMTQPWGFELEQIHFPVHIWHGQADRMAPFPEIEKVAEAMPNCQTHFIPEAGHFLTSDESIWSEILQTIKKEASETEL